jgi:hypothetical protein
MEDVPARSHHVLSTTQNARSTISHATSARRSNRGENRNLNILHADGTVEYHFLTVTRPMLVIILGFGNEISLVAPGEMQSIESLQPRGRRLVQDHRAKLGGSRKQEVPSPAE